MPDMREEFEAWLLREHGLESEWQDERNCFKDYPAHLAFKAWQASRAALRVELPYPVIVDEGAEFAFHAYDKDETDKALQQAGIEVK
ncbi:TPA: hypothetical protein L5D52_001326 [Pseudomonas aeruginosa]|nr:hypothetical protein [Pseudomonas aeruginosa]